MFLVGIDVAKDKHDCCIINSDGEFPEEVFSTLNNREGYETLYKRICSLAVDLAKVKVGLESTGHYSSNLLAFLGIRQNNPSGQPVLPNRWNYSIP